VNSEEQEEQVLTNLNDYITENGTYKNLYVALHEKVAL